VPPEKHNFMGLLFHCDHIAWHQLGSMICCLNV